MWSAATVTAAILDRAGRYDEALGIHLGYIDYALNTSQPRLLWKARTDLGVAYHLQGKLQEAEDTYRAALEEVPPEDPNHFVLMANLGEVLLDLGRVDDAAEYLLGALPTAVGRTSLRVYMLALLVEAECRRGSVDAARALADQEASEFETALKQDPTLGYVLDRMQSALSRAEA